MDFEFVALVALKQYWLKNFHTVQHQMYECFAYLKGEKS